MRATDNHAPPLVAAYVLLGQPASGMRSTSGGVEPHFASAALPGDDTTQLVSGDQASVCAAHVPRSQEACDSHPRQAMPAQIKEKRKVTHHRALEGDLSQRSVQGCDECLETTADVLVHAADMMRDWRHRNKSQQSATKCIEPQH